jgi:type I restriction enzyme, S subunit
MKWDKTSLGNVISLEYGKSLPDRNRKTGKIPVYGSGGIGGFHDKSLVSGPGIIVGRKGTVGSVYWETEDFFPIDTVYYVVPNEKEITMRFSYYLLKYLPLNSLNTDAAVPGLNRNNALRLKIKLPKLEAQNQITEILSAYDDLIENNRRRIRLLEKSAQLLYNEWFVNLRFPGHEHTKIVNGIPQGWTREFVGSLLTLQRGFDLPIQARVDGQFPIYASTGINGFHKEAKAKGPGVVTGRSGSLGTVIYVQNDYWPLNTTLWVKEFKKITPIFTTHLLRSLQLERYNGGAAVPTLNRNDVHKIEVLSPPQKLIQLFEDSIGANYIQIDVLKKYNIKLEAARDILLPRLMNGELVV